MAGRGRCRAATCRSACDRLDAHPDLVFTRGDAWSYEQIEKVDPGLFERIRKHIEAGRWAIVGGWWIQPDCNLPSDFALREQIQIGKEYLTQRFGIGRGWRTTSTRSGMPRGCRP